MPKIMAKKGRGLSALLDKHTLPTDPEVEDYTGWSMAMKRIEKETGKVGLEATKFHAGDNFIPLIAKRISLLERLVDDIYVHADHCSSESMVARDIVHMIRVAKKKVEEL
jgi:hypothetical protein